MQVEVKIDQDAVQQQLVQAILQSAIGANLEKYINEALTRPTGGGWDRDSRNLVQRAVDDAVAQEIRKIATEIVQSKHAEIHSQMEAKLTDAVLAKMADVVWAVMEGKLRAAD